MDKLLTKTFLLTIYILSCICINIDPVLATPSKILPSESILNLKSKAIKAYQKGEYQESISIWSNLLKKQNLNPNTKAEIHSNIAAIYQKTGRVSKAISNWQKAILIYRKSKPESLKLLTKVILDKAQAHNILGQTQYSKLLLEEAVSITSPKELSELRAVAYQALGNAHQIEGNLQLAISNYSQSLAIAKKLNNNKLTIVALNNLSNTYHLQYLKISYQANFAQESGNKTKNLVKQSSLKAQKAWHNANQAVEKSEINQTLAAVEAKIHLLKLFKVYSQAKLVGDIPRAEYLENAKKTLLLVPDSQRKAQGLIQLARLQEGDRLTLNAALEVAVKIGDLRTQSLALGYLGNYYEGLQNYEQALELTYQAQRLATQTRSSNLLYRWDWQAGRILSRLSQTQEAQIAYRQAINSLQLIRNQISTNNNPNSQINFKLEVEPVYRELISLLLTKKNSESEIKQALKVKKLLHLSELENFFGDDCIITQADNSQVSSSEREKTTIVHTIILDQKTYLILQLPDGGVKSFSLPVSRKKMDQVIKQWRYNLENQENDSYLSLSEELYQLLIKTIEPELAATDTKNLVFVNDGILRNVPMAALYDGKNFLVEKYAITNSLGFDLKSNESNSKINVLTFGLTSGSNDSRPLPYVREELTKIASITNTRSFLNQEFNLNNFAKQIKNKKYDVIHIATHSKFKGTAEQTYLQVYQQKISLGELEQIFNQREINSKIKLLTLSACDTAVGNDRAILGLAGIAIRSNVDTILGSLWSVSDEEMASFTANFYHYWLKEKLSKSEALQLAQIDLIKNPNLHPAIWSTLVLIEN